MSLGVEYFLAISAALFAIGAFGVVAKRHLAAVLMSAGLMFASSVVALAAFARFSLVAGHRVGGQAFAIVVVLAACGQVLLGFGVLRLALRQRVGPSVDDVAG